ncbi:MAG: hypothetical protein NZ108_00730 [Bacteroidia bacterium]|nr:hypothetical protein [Bacteroidia bacterium]
MSIVTELNPGEIRFRFEALQAGKISFANLGLQDKDLVIKGGNLRIVFDFGALGDIHFFKSPTIEFHYHEKISESSWQAEFNGEVVSDKNDHSGSHTLILLNRNKLNELRHRHNNQLIIRGDLPQEVTLVAKDTYFNLLEAPGS